MIRRKGLLKTIQDFNMALEQGQAVVYRWVFGSSSYEYIGGYIKDLTGYSQEEITPAIWDSLIVRTEQKGELLGLSLEEANRRVRSGQVTRWQADVQIKTRSGELRWVTDMSSVIQEDHDTDQVCLGVLLDITDRKETEKRLAKLTKTLHTRNEEVEADLAMAREVQNALIEQQPHQFPEQSDTPDLFFNHKYIPTEMLAGDFFEIVPVSENKVGVFVCDVMGHGVRAALLTTFLRGLIEELIVKTDDPGLFLETMNHSLHSVFCRDDNLLFATAIYLIIDTSTGVIKYANAGHSSPICLQPENNCVIHLNLSDEQTEPALGIVDNFVYTTAEHKFAAMESLLLYTDGIFEEYSPSEEMYGEQRVDQFITTNLNLPPEELIDQLITDVHQFSESDSFEDDACLLSVTPALSMIK